MVMNHNIIAVFDWIDYVFEYLPIAIEPAGMRQINENAEIAEFLGSQ